MGYLLIWILSLGFIALGIIMFVAINRSPETIYAIISKISGMTLNDNIMIGSFADLMIQVMAIGLIIIGGVILATTLRGKTVSDMKAVFWSDILVYFHIGETLKEGIFKKIGGSKNGH